MGALRAVRPFRARPYRILIAALVASMLGAGTWVVTLAVEVQEVGGTASDLSVAASLNAVGLLGAVLIAGVVADRVSQKLILVVGEAVKVLAFATAAVLAFSGQLEFWHLALISLVLGVTDGFFYPAYVSLLPTLVPPEDLQPANGIEGTLRPVLQQAGGPLIAGAAIAAASPAVALAIVAVLQLLVVGALVALRPPPSRRPPREPARRPLGALVSDVRDALRYFTGTRWVLGALLYSAFWVLLVMGTVEVLLPFAVPALTGGEAESYALVLAAYGIGGAVGALVVASLPFPRRYLTALVSAWGLGTVPLALVGITTELWVMVVALAVAGAAFAGGQVLWNTLLQRRVPSAMLGRVSSVDLFLTILLMPIALAIAGPIGEAVGFTWAFLVAGLVPPVLGVVVIVVFRMRRDEIDHPVAAAPADDEPVIDEPSPASGG